MLIGRRHYPVKPVGAVITGQDRRDFTAEGSPPGVDAARLYLPGHRWRRTGAQGLTPLQAASALLGTPARGIAGNAPARLPRVRGPARPGGLPGGCGPPSAAGSARRASLTSRADRGGRPCGVPR
ncbi:hypothetical protein ACU686_03440 [Yinghuangia aomiensis]